MTRDLRDRIRRALCEDVGRGDVTTRAVIDGPTAGRAVIMARERGIVCGLPVVAEVFRTVDRQLRVRALRGDGEQVAAGDEIFDVRGNLASILTAERVALNFLQHLSGIATLTQRYVEALGGSRTQILDTRKATPLWRDLEKYAVRVGGGTNHRFGLDDMVLIKNNHADAAGGLGEAIRRVKRAFRGRKRLPIMAEARNLGEVRIAVAEKADMILLDNFSRGSLRRALREIPSPILTEASGGMTIARVRSLADLGLDRISVGALTHSAPALDFSLRYRKP
jgi:nicotinate-nucleotide pyrophosphorylase (carboxylating)